MISIVTKQYTGVGSVYFSLYVLSTLCHEETLGKAPGGRGCYCSHEGVLFTGLLPIVVFISVAQQLHRLSCLLYLHSHHHRCCRCRSRSLRIQTCQLPPHRETNGLIKSLFFYFSNKDPGTRCWGINLQPQRSRESSQWTSPIVSERHHPLLCLKTKLPQPDVPLFLLPVPPFL